MNPPTDPREELARQLDALEGRIDAAIALIARLRREKQELEARLAESAEARREAQRRLDSVLDKIETLL